MTTEKKAAKSLLDRGISIAVGAPWLLRIFRKKQIKLIVHQPRLGTLYRISDLYLQMNIDIEKMQGMNVNEALTTLHNSVKIMSRIVACAILGYWGGKFFSRLLAGYIFRNAKPNELYLLFYSVIMFSGVKDFLNTIRLASVMTMTEPMNLSPEEKGS